MAKDEMTSRQKQAVVRFDEWMFNPLTIARTLNRILRDDEQEVGEDDVSTYLDSHLRMLDNIEKDYQQNELPRVRKGIQEMIAEVPQIERDEMKRRYLLDEVREAKKTPGDRERVQKLSLQVHIFTGRKEGIAPEKIVQAANYPISELIKVRGGMAVCPFHPDKTPSMDVRKNFYFCYGCGETGNAIHLVRKLENLTFKQAITRLI